MKTQSVIDTQSTAFSKQSIALDKYITVGRTACARNVSRSVAYKTLPGMKSPSIVMVPGLHSYTHMSGQKASCLLRCRLQNYNEALYVDD